MLMLTAVRPSSLAWKYLLFNLELVTVLFTVEERNGREIFPVLYGYKTLWKIP